MEKVNKDFTINQNKGLTCLLPKEGWEGRFFGSEPRISEIVELYEELGLEVLVETLDPLNCNGCTECFKDAQNPLLSVYTRKKI